jgi:hypothetical protein
MSPALAAAVSTWYFVVLFRRQYLEEKTVSGALAR